ncbi:acyl-CoA thioesterase domain-containing protein [Pseudoalteromonas sp. MMG024]|uniref:acyl-CoA thioesterase domain-containing protein n=1 Tax=Pseudoalteromonas sp. MMG024 TaxID=2909980 RepID=UPI001F1A91EF|nr:acyl-CoA thioesterase domain-containing protein [Pseudoalteromonas sp. MMG024]MCF6458058.1 thioesterase family protein [Pseudoalteromonas sp. MMG024]
MTFDELVEKSKEQVASNHKSEKIEISEKWTQGRTVFGGLSAGLLLAASEQVVSAEKELHSAYTSFIGPLLADTSFEIDVSILREGNNVVQVLAKAMQNGQVAVLQQSSFGIKRASSVELNNIQSHSMEIITEATLDQSKLIMAPNFLQHFEFALTNGKEPFSGSDDSKDALVYNTSGQVLAKSHQTIAIFD